MHEQKLPRQTLTEGNLHTFTHRFTSSPLPLSSTSATHITNKIVAIVTTVGGHGSKGCTVYVTD